MSRATAYDGIDLMLNCENEEERDDLTQKWRDHKLQELNFIGTVGALLASCLSSTGSWPDVLNNGRSKPWIVRTLNFSGLVFALFAVMVACLQSMRLHRLSSHRDGLKMIRAGLAGGRGRSSRSKSKTSSTGLRLRQRLYPWIQAYAWDASHTFLILSVVFMIAGIAVLVWVSTMNGPDQPDDAAWWDENSKMAVTFTCVLAFSIVVLFGAQAAIMDRDSETDEQGGEDGRIRLSD